MRVLFVSGYELGHQPLGVAAPAGKLRARGHDVRIVDLGVEPWDAGLVDWADRVAVSVPMHTATRIAREVIRLVRARRADVPVCCFGLYASMTADLGVHVLAGETGEALGAWVEECGCPDASAADLRREVDGPARPEASTVHLGREAAAPGAPLPARDLLPGLDRYARLVVGDEERLAGYVEASHGCRHRCRHCPVPVIYDGRLRVVHHDAVLADVAQQVAAGARHLTFGDPDFFNAVPHALRIVRAMHEQFPDVTFDCTVKVEHILAHRSVWAELAASGCRFVVSAFETVDDDVLRLLDKGHTTADASQAVRILRGHGIEIRPSFLPFTPWTTVETIRALLRFVIDHDLVGNVDPVQYTIRLLLPQGSLLLGLPELASFVGPYDVERCQYPWVHRDPAVDALQRDLAALVEEHVARRVPIVETFTAICDRVGVPAPRIDQARAASIPRLTEPWFCCAEPTTGQLLSLAPVPARSHGREP